MKLKRLFTKNFKFLKKIGPGFITGASDDDPSGLTAYAQAGAQYGYSILWTALWMVPSMVCIQEMAARVAIVKGEGITTSLLRKFSRPFVFILVLCLLIANIINIGADIAGMAEAMTLITPLPYTAAAVILTLGIVALQIFLPYKKYVVILQVLCLSLISYVITACVVKVQWSSILYQTIVPSINFFDKEFWYLMVGLLGTTISPYLIFWQSSQEVEEKKAQGLSLFETSKEHIQKMRTDTFVGMFFSNFIVFCVVLVTASYLFVDGLKIRSMGDAASVLQPLAGSYACWLFSLGVIGTGLLVIPVLAGSAAYAMADFFGWKQGLALTWREAPQFYAVILGTTIIGLLLNFIGANVVDFLIFASVMNGLAMPLLLIGLIIVANDVHIVGEYKSTKLLNILGWTTFALFVGSIIGYFILAYCV